MFSCAQKFFGKLHSSIPHKEILNFNHFAPLLLLHKIQSIECYEKWVGLILYNNSFKKYPGSKTTLVIFLKNVALGSIAGPGLLDC